MLTLETKSVRANCKPQRILIIDDEPSIRDALADSLQQERYEVLTAAEGKVGLEFVLKSPPTDAEAIDLLILDLLLPDMSGLDLCQAIRRNGSNLPILMISAKADESDRVIGLEVGADDYLPKPFGMRELVARCRALLRRWDAPASAVPTLLQVRDVVLNLQAASVWVRGETVTLSPKEMQLLELFMQHPQKVWSREQIMRQIWGKDFVGDQKTLDVHIRWLREKLEVNPSRPEYLITMRGFGYRFG